MSYSSTYKNCGKSDAKHVCPACPEDAAAEYARARGSGFIDELYIDTLMVDPTDPDLWQAGISAGLIDVVPETSGSFEPGDPDANGFSENVLKFNDPSYKENYHFYNDAKLFKTKIPFFLTSSLVNIFDRPAVIVAKNPVVDDITSRLVWQVTCTVRTDNIPSFHSAAGIREVLGCANLHAGIDSRIIPLRTLEGLPIDALDLLDIYNIEGDWIGEAASPAAYVSLWNADPENAASGSVISTSSLPGFFYVKGGNVGFLLAEPGYEGNPPYTSPFTAVFGIS